MLKPEVTVIKGRIRRNELGDALINPSASLASTALLTDAAGKRWYLPTFRPAAASADGRVAFETSVSDDGTFRFFLASTPPADAGDAAPRQTGTSFALVLNASGNGRRFPLQDRQQGDVRELSVTLTGNDLKMARASLFDADPNVSIEVTQTLTLAAQQTQTFVSSNWDNNTIRRGLLDLFGGIPFDSASSYYMLASQADSEFGSDYLLLKASYLTQMPAPPLPGYVQWQVNWENRAYNYYQDNQDRTRIFYSPESFEFAKGPAGSPTVSLLSFSLPDGPDTVDKTRAAFRLYGRPVVNFDRIQHATLALKDKIGAAPQMVSLQDAHHVKTAFTQYLPNARASDSAPVEQANASIDLSEGLRNELALSFAQFRALWAAIFSTAPENPLFRGWVDVELLGGKFKERIDFNGRLPKDLEQSFFDDILDTSVENTYPATFTIKTVKKVFDGDPAVVDITLTFAGGKTATLTEDQLVAQVVVERSIADIVIGKQSPDEYPYRMSVVRDDGTIAYCDGKARSDTPIMWLSRDQIAKCAVAADGVPSVP